MSDGVDINDATIMSLAETIGVIWSSDNSKGWNDYPIYVECDDGIVRKVKIVGSRMVPHGHKSESFVYDGGFYLKAYL